MGIMDLLDGFCGQGGSLLVVGEEANLRNPLWVDSPVAFDW